MRQVVAVLLSLLASGVSAQTTITPGGGSGSSTITSGSTVTSGCVAGGVLRSISNMVDCGAGLTYAGSVFAVTGAVTLGGSTITGTTVAATINNGTSTGNILNLQDNGSNVFTVADGGAVTGGKASFVGGPGDPMYFYTTSVTQPVYIGNAGANGLYLDPSSGNTSLTSYAKQSFQMFFSQGSSLTANHGFLFDQGNGGSSTGFGNMLTVRGWSSTTAAQNMVAVGGVWTDATHASRSAAIVFETVNNAGSLTERARIHAAGGLQLASGTKPTCDSSTGGTIFRVAGGAGVADAIEVCAKSSADAYAWYPMATIP